jgi:hypothetical protein
MCAPQRYENARWRGTEDVHHDSGVGRRDAGRRAGCNDDWSCDFRRVRRHFYNLNPWESPRRPLWSGENIVITNGRASHATFAPADPFRHATRLSPGARFGFQQPPHTRRVHDNLQTYTGARTITIPARPGVRCVRIKDFVDNPIKYRPCKVGGVC